jgi:cell division protein FtsI (penicillin-binding protein 3)
MFRTRQYLVFLLLTAFLAGLFARLFFLQILNFERFSAMAEDQHNRVIEIEPRRGTIFDRYMDPLAINIDVQSVYCDPRSIRDKEHTAEVLSDTLGISRQEVDKKLARDKAFVWVKRKIDQASYERLSRENAAGVHFVTESKRKYPNDNMASHVIGFVGIDNNGLEGLELMFDADLKGRSGWRHMFRDARMQTVLFNEKESIPAQNGQNLVLTLDSVIQYIAEDELAGMVKKFNAAGGSVIVMDPYTGKILAMANYPDYDLNSFRSAPREFMKNDSVSSIYEPGSVFKVVTASAAIETGTVTMDDRIYCENGKFNVCGRILNDYRPHGELSFREVVSKSSNIGVVKVAQKMGAETLFEYIQKFGFGEKTGIDMVGEAEGISRPPSVWSRSDITTIPMGQGIAVTSIQLAAAISVIANGGDLMRPYMIEKITTWQGSDIKDFSPLKRRTVITKETCDKIKAALRDVVTVGTGKQAGSKIYETCGKTGTAQMVDPKGGYYPDKYYATFIGFAPVEEPMISIVVIARDPRPLHFGGTVAGPTFRRVAERTLEYLGAEKIKKTK